jgi:ParB family chromosome partitioning protein
MVGKGLESLIPKKKKPEDEQFSVNDSQPFPLNEGGELKPPSLPAVNTLEAGHFFDNNKGDLLTEGGFSDSWLKNQRKNFQRERTFTGSDAVFQIEVEKIKPNPLQPRRDFNKEELSELAQSIREFGILQPLVVSKVLKETDSGAEVEYQLIAGERRLMAAKLIGLPRVPAIIKKIDEQRVKLELALIENIQRRDLNPIEEARAYASLQDEFGLTQREIAARVGKSREAVANTMRLLNLPVYIQEALAQRKLSESQGRALLAIANIQEQERAFLSFLSQKVSSRILHEKIEKPKTTDLEGQYWQKQFEEKLGISVKLLRNGYRGKLILRFYSEDEWQNIVRRLLGEENL